MTALFYCALTMVLAFPLTVHPGGMVMSSGVDTNLFLWTIAWNAHALARHPFALFEANTFFPFHDSLAFSENLLGSSVIAAPILWAGGGLVLAMNIVALTSIPISALGAFVLARQLNVTRPAAVLAGLIFGFSPPRFFRLDQVHLTTVQWIPFALAYAHAYLQRRRPRDARLAIAFFTLQALASGHGAVFLLVALLLLVAYHAATGTLPPMGQCVREVGVTGTALLVPALLMFAPYYRVQDEMGLRRGLDDFRIVSWQSFLASPSHVHRWLVDTFIPGVHVFAFAGAYLFPGIVPLLLAAIAIVPRLNRSATSMRARRLGQPLTVATTVVLELLMIVTIVLALYVSFVGPIRWRIGDTVLMSVRDAARVWMLAAVSAIVRVALIRRAPLQPAARVRGAVTALQRLQAATRDRPVLFYGLLTILCVWLSMAPPFGLWSYVYWLPGFDFIRAPSRFMVLGVLAIAVLAAFGFDRAARRLAPTGRAVWAAMLALAMVAEFSAAPLGITADDNRIPAIDHWLASQDGPLVVAEAPVDPRVLQRDLQQSIYMRHSMAHWHKTVHGYSGIHPPLTEGLYEHLTVFPEPETLHALQSIGVTTIVVHLDAYPADKRPEILRRIAEQPELKLEHADGDGRIYALAAARPIP